MASIPPLLIVGAVAVLFPIFAFITLQNINRQNENSIRLMLEKGAALIRSFEAGTRTGMRGTWWNEFQLQKLLSETAQLSDIIHLIVSDLSGVVLAHNDLSKVGFLYGTDLNLERIAQSPEIHWRQASNAGGEKVFEIYRKFSPTGDPMHRYRNPMMRKRNFEPSSPKGGPTPQKPSDRIIFVGLDMGPVEAARKADTRHSLFMGFILLLIGFVGVILLFLAQSYRSARTSLARVKAFSDNLVERMPIGLIAIDDKGKIASFNQIAGMVLGISSPELGGDAARLLPGELCKQIEDLRTDEEVIVKEIQCTLRNGKSIPLETSAARLHDGEGAFLGCVLLFRDLSEMHSLRREIERGRRLASVGQLAAGVAHEIRNPLSSIKGFATYFKERYREKAEDQQIASLMIQEVDRLNRVVGQLLEFAKPVAISKKKRLMLPFFEGSLKLIERQAAEKRIRIETRFAAEIKDALFDADRMGQVLLNLYLNAIESMEEGGVLTLNVEFDSDRNRLQIAVADTGTGIREADTPRIFDPYFTTKSSGAGLGLAIVHNIVQAHGGEIDVKSKPGKGTTVTIFLPCL